MIYITGDTHRNFERIRQFCDRFDTTTDDIMIILGDAGINYYLDAGDEIKKDYLSTIPVTLFCIHGNHEARPESIPSYQEMEWHGGVVYYEDKYPNLLFAKDGEIYDLDGKKTIAIGGAYSVDKEYRLAMGAQWFADEQPSEEIKKRVEAALDASNWEVDVVLSHTVPICYEPTEVFLKGIDQSKVDKSTERWLGSIEYKLAYKKWYAGHYHTEKKIDKLELMFTSIDEFAKELDMERNQDTVQDRE